MTPSCSLGARRLSVRCCPSRRFAAVVLLTRWKGSSVSRKGLFKRGRRAAGLLAAGLGACALLLVACSPVQAGSAAIVGDQRITVSSLDTQVSNLQAAAKPYGSVVQIKPAQMSAAVLSWMIRFEVMDEMAASSSLARPPRKC